MIDLVYLLGVFVSWLAGVCVAVWVLVRQVQAWWWRRCLVAFELRLARRVTVDDVSRWAGTLRSILRSRRWWSLLPRWPICVETTATQGGVRHVMVVPRRLRTDVLATATAVLPGVRLDELAYYWPERGGVRFQVAAEARLKEAGELLAVDRGEDTSRHLLAALQPLESGEVVRVQWLLAGAWAPGWVTAPSTDPAMLPAVWKQTDDPMLRAVCRVAVASRLGRNRARALYGRVWAALRGMNTPRTRLIRRWWLPSLIVAARLAVWAMPLGRWPTVLTSRELGGLLGLATGQVSLPGVCGGVSRTLPPPPSMPTSGLVVAASNWPGTRTRLCLSTSDRLRHLWMVGPTGVGKSTLLANMIGHDIHYRDGVVVVDARGDLATDVLDRIPTHRANDVIVIDPTATNHAVGINPLHSGPPEQAAGFVFHVLHSIYATSWGPRTADILRASLLTLATTRALNRQPFTLVELPELLTNTSFRRVVTGQSLSPQLGSFWRWYDSLPVTQQLTIISPVLNKLRTFTLSTPLRLLLGQSCGINLGEAMATKKIVLVPLKKGLLGAENAALIGSLVMASLWQATLNRATTPASKRHAFWLYIDEFQDVLRLPIDLADMLAQARGLGLGLTLAHQYLGQLPSDMKTAVTGTARTQLVFQLGHSDAKDMAIGFNPLAADDLLNLGAYEIAVRPCVGGVTQPPVTGTTYPLPEPVTNGQDLAETSRRRYGMSRIQIEAAMADRTTVAHPAGKRSNRIPTTQP